MCYLYLLSESDTDDLFYESLAERITGKNFEVIPIRARRGTGSGTINRLARRILISIQHTGHSDDTYFLFSIDNDRAPQFDDDALPAQELPASEQGKANRHQTLHQMAHKVLGSDRSQWPVKGAIAVPVEMLESWILLGCTEIAAKDLPIFSRTSSPLAKQYFAPHEPPPQLKDLAADLRKSRGIESNAEFFLCCATEWINMERLAEQSRSFAFLYIPGPFSVAR